MTIRKMFHILAFLLFLPGVIFNVKEVITPSIDEIDGFCIQLCLRATDLHGIREVFPEREGSNRLLNIRWLLQKFL